MSKPSKPSKPSHKPTPIAAHLGLDLAKEKVDAAVLTAFLTATGAFLAAPVLVQFDEIDLGAWQVDHTGEAYEDD